ncbi:MAG: hypothetical protein OET21_03560 [Desulfobacterales bacterium]|jgi:hypothetical protein|nr:hypothetical protein [Desulfobacterales bacterium]
MSKPSKPPGDDFKIRCPKLGHQIYFSYCAKENQGVPCYRTLDCWFEHFEVAAFFEKALTPAQWKAAFEKPLKPKMISLLEMIEQAKNRQTKES